MTQALRLLAPEAEIDFRAVGRLSEQQADAAEFVRELGAFDHLVVTRIPGRFRDGSGIDAVKAATGAVELPVLLFSAFHPDLVYVFDRASGTGATIRGPLGDYHSALTLFAFLEGLDAAQAARLFEADTYRLLGYFDFWDSSAEWILSAGRLAGWNLADDLMRWTRRGAFMHSVNHPKLHVVADLARGVASRLGLPAPEIDLEAYLTDEFVRQGSWPIYPPIAAHYGVPGSDLFLTHGPNGRPRAVALEVVLEASYAAYRGLRSEDLDCHRIATWRGYASLRDELIRRARG